MVKSRLKTKEKNKGEISISHSGNFPALAMDGVR